MAKRIIWSARAKDGKTVILRFWKKKNKSNIYPKKLNRLIKDAVEGLSGSPTPRNYAINYAAHRINTKPIVLQCVFTIPIS